MIPQAQNTLLSYFQDGDFPNEAQFAELVNTFFYLYQDAVGKAAALQAVTAGIPTAWVDAVWLGGSQGAWTYRKTWGVTSVQLVKQNVTGGVHQGFKIVFANAFLDTNFITVDPKYIQGANIFTTIAKTTTDVTLSGSTAIFGVNAPPPEGTIVRGVFF